MSIINKIFKFLNFIKSNKEDDYIIEDNYICHKILMKDEYINNNLLSYKDEQNNLKINNIIEIRSIIVGVFYYSDNNIKLPAININDKVKKGQIIGFIKSLDNFNAIICEYNGIIQEVCVKDFDIVEYNKLLFIIKII